MDGLPKCWYQHVLIKYMYQLITCINVSAYKDKVSVCNVKVSTYKDTVSSCYNMLNYQHTTKKYQNKVIKYHNIIINIRQLKGPQKHILYENKKSLGTIFVQNESKIPIPIYILKLLEY